MTLYFVRHGHTNYNRLGILNDDPSVDVHLTKKGIAQVEETAEELKDVPFDAIYTSQFPRTIQTAEIINKYHGLDLTQDERINENRTGYGGLPHSLRWFTFHLAGDNKYTKRFRNGESLEDSKKRVDAFLDDIIEKHENDTVLVVAHANTGWIINGYVNDLSLEDTFKGNIVNGHPIKYKI